MEANYSSGVGFVEVEIAIDRAHVYLGAAFQKGVGIAVVLNVGKQWACVPFSLLGYIYGYDFVFVAVDSRHGLIGRDY